MLTTAGKPSLWDELWDDKEGVKLQAAVLEAVGSVRIRTMDRPQPGPGEVLLAVRQTGICGSEVHAFLGTHPFRVPPCVLGHEVVGTVLQTGERVAPELEGTRVVVLPQVPCGDCPACRRGRGNACRAKRVLGTREWPGGFAEYLVAPAETLYQVPVHLSDDQAVMVEPMAVGLHAIARAGVVPGSQVAILGLGTIGMCILKAALAEGATRVVVTDVRQERLDLVQQVERVVAVLPDQIDALRLPDGAEAVFVVAGKPSVLQTALTLVQPAGTVVLLAMFDEHPTLDTFRVVGPEVNLLGANMYSREEFQQAIDFVYQHDLGSCVGERGGLSDLEHLLRSAGENRLSCLKAVLVHRQDT